MSTQQPEALRLAARLRAGYSNLRGDLEPAAAELERLHAQVQKLESQKERDPLSYQKIRDAWYDCGIGTSYDIPPSQDDIDWARAIERAHGITQSITSIEETDK